MWLIAFALAATLVGQPLCAEATPPVQSVYGGIDQAAPDTSGEDQPPGSIDDRSGATVGLRMSFNVPGKIIGVRYLKKSQVSGMESPRKGLVYDKAGTLIASGDFPNTAELGWQYLTFDSPVTIVPGDTYVVAYWTDSGYTYQYKDPPSVDSTVGDIYLPFSHGVFQYGMFPTVMPFNTYPAVYFADVSFIADDTPGPSTCGAGCSDAVKTLAVGEYSTQASTEVHIAAVVLAL